MRLPPIFAALILAAATTAAGCAPTVGANTIPASSVGQINRVDEGRVISARVVTIQGDGRGIGVATGAVLGGIGGAEAGGDRTGQIAGGVAGAVVGGIIGSVVEKGVTRTRGIEYTIQKRNGEIIAIVQGADVVIEPGTPVQILYGGDRVRVVPLRY